jgi:putative phage-type endonuclease
MTKLKGDLEIVDVEQGSEEWHEYRQGKRPASITPMLMGTSKFQDAADAYDAMQGEQEDAPSFVEKIRDWGNRMEPKARAKLSEILGQPVFPVVGHRGQYSASLDGFVVVGGKRIGYEIKAPFSGARSQTWKAAVKDQIEPGYADQIEHQVQVFDLDEAYLFVYVDDTNWRLEQYRYRDGRWEEIEKGWVQFVKRHLETFTRPNPYAEREDSEWSIAAGIFVNAKNALDDAEKVVEEARERLIKLADGKKSSGFGVAVNIYPKRGALDYKAALEFYAPEVEVEPFRKAPSTVTSVNILKEKAK